MFKVLQGADLAGAGPRFYNDNAGVEVADGRATV